MPLAPSAAVQGRLVLTHPEPRIDRVAAHLRAQGIDVVVLPARRIVPQSDEPSDASDAAAPLARLAEYTWVIPVSPGAVDAALARRAAGWPRATGLAAVGPGTVAALARAGLAAPTVRVVAPVSPPFDADALLALPEFLHGAGARVLVLRGASGRDGWVDVLRARGFVVDVVRAYRLEAAEPAAGEIDRLRAWVACDAPAAFAFSSVDAIDVTLRRLEAAGALDWAMRQRALVLHPRHAAHLAGLGWSRTVQVAPGEAALMQALESA